MAGATATNTNSAYPVSNLTDDTTSNPWRSNTLAAGQTVTVTVDLGQSQSVASVYLDFYSFSYRAESFDLQVCTESSSGCTTMAQITGNYQSPLSLDFAPVSGRYVRLANMVGAGTVLALREINAYPGVEHVINPTSVFAADVTGDGHVDVLAASSSDDKIVLFENNGAQNFSGRVVSVDADYPWAVFAADVDGDSDLDVLSASYSDDKIAWYENDAESEGSFTERQVGHVAEADEPYRVHAVDVDGDGDVDLLSASQNDDKIAWYENDGEENFTPRVIVDADSGAAKADGARDVHAVDVDGDGDVDVLSASYVDDKIAWYENDGAENFTPRVIVDASSGTDRADGAGSVYALDVDGDGDVDVLSASYVDDKIAWYENDGAENFTPRVIVDANSGAARADGAWDVHAVDLDGDGDVDVLSASYVDDKIAWYENDGEENFTARVIVNGDSGAARADGARSVHALDVDGDGDVDVLSASQSDDKIAWYENDGEENFTPRVIVDANSGAAKADGAWDVHAVDLDGDGDEDVLSASYVDDKIAWYENDGEENFTARVISVSVGEPVAVTAVDLNGDGALEVVAAGWEDNISWFSFESDNCPLVANEDQADADADGVGDACNDAEDADEDEWVNLLDNCPGVSNPDQIDTDGDGVGNACDEDDHDADNDGWPDETDNCPADPNPDQADAETDGVGDVCDTNDDEDGDSVLDAEDNCPNAENPDQLDADQDGAGDACDVCAVLAPSCSVERDRCQDTGEGYACCDATDDCACGQGLAAADGDCLDVDECLDPLSCGQGASCMNSLAATCARAPRAKPVLVRRVTPTTTGFAPPWLAPKGATAGPIVGAPSTPRARFCL